MLSSFKHSNKPVYGSPEKPVIATDLPRSSAADLIDGWTTKAKFKPRAVPITILTG